MREVTHIIASVTNPELNKIQWKELGQTLAPGIETYNGATDFLRNQATFKRELRELLLRYDASLFFSFDSDADIKDLQGEIEYSATEKGEKVIGNVLVEGWHLHGSDLEKENG